MAELVFAPQQGFGTTLAEYVGRRFLDEENTVVVGGYLNLAATVSYAYQWYQVRFESTHLTNQQLTISENEFGSESFYILRCGCGWHTVGYTDNAWLPSTIARRRH
jgi:hypothetical protein